MTQTERFQREADEITQRTGRYIAPYRLANLMKTAQKITDILIRSDVCATYDEISLVLQIVNSAVNSATGQGES